MSGYDTIRNDRSTGQGGGAAFLVKHDLVVNKGYRSRGFNIITNNEALAIDLELSNNQNLTLASIYCPNGDPNLTLFQTINNLLKSIKARFSLTVAHFRPEIFYWLVQKIRSLSPQKQQSYNFMIKSK